MQRTALIIDDETDIRELIAMSLDRIGLETHTASNLEEARNLLDTYKFDVCLTDMKLPDGNGVEFVKQVLAVQPGLPVAVITAHGNMNAAVEAMKNGAFDFMSKPVDITQLRAIVTQAINTSNNAPTSDIRTLPQSGTNENGALDVTNLDAHHSPQPRLKESHRLVGKSTQMVELRRTIDKVSKTNAPVWITGESGTGKELIARLIHANSSRAESPFVAINCGAIPSELMESEFFGHKKGSFTGAYSEHEGLFMRASGGTLFLDEVAELPLHMQVKLLRAIQERSIRPVGASSEKPTNVRIVSASHKDLEIEASEGRFRNDLYYRLNVINVKAPALRDRISDIPEIAATILQKITDREQLNYMAELSHSAFEKLTRYSFPGNVRELENIIERAVAMTECSVIGNSDLSLPTEQLPEKSNHTQPTTNPQIQKNDCASEVKQALDECRWNRKQAAAKLGLTYRQLRYRIERYGLDEDVG